MINRRHRFHGHGSLRSVYQRGQTVRGPLLSLRSIKNERTKSYRLAVVVSKKVSKSAVTRNRIRRRLYEQVRLLEGQIVEPHDMVLSVFSDELATIPHAALTSLVQDHLSKSHILAKASTPVRGKIEGKGE